MCEPNPDDLRKISQSEDDETEQSSSESETEKEIKLIRAEIDKILREKVKNKHQTVNFKQEHTPVFASRFLKNFDVCGILGNGRFSTVFQVKHKFVRLDYALKRIEVPRLGNENIVRMVRAMAQLDHPGVLQCNATWIEDPPDGWQTETDARILKQIGMWGDSLNTNSRADCIFIYIQMQMCNYSLEGWLRNNHTQSSRSIPRMKSWFKQMVVALDYLHDKCILHRNIKPSNILFVEEDRVKLSDVGLVMEFGEDNEEVTSLKMCTKATGVLYISPEQKQSRISYSSKTDIFSLGLVLAEMCTVMTEDTAKLIFDDYRSGRDIRILNNHPELKLFVAWLTNVIAEERPDCGTILRHSFLENKKSISNDISASNIPANTLETDLNTMPVTQPIPSATHNDQNVTPKITNLTGYEGYKQWLSSIQRYPAFISNYWCAMLAYEMEECDPSEGFKIPYCIVEDELIKEDNDVNLTTEDAFISPILRYWLVHLLKAYNADVSVINLEDVLRSFISNAIPRPIGFSITLARSTLFHRLPTECKLWLIYMLRTYKKPARTLRTVVRDSLGNVYHIVPECRLYAVHDTSTNTSHPIDDARLNNEPWGAMYRYVNSKSCILLCDNQKGWCAVWNVFLHYELSYLRSIRSDMTVKLTEQHLNAAMREKQRTEFEAGMRRLPPIPKAEILEKLSKNAKKNQKKKISNYIPASKIPANTLEADLNTMKVTQPTPSTSHNVQAPQNNYSNKIMVKCRNFPQCPFTHKCKYVHPSKPCIKFPNCPRGWECLFLHDFCSNDSQCGDPNCPYEHIKSRPTYYRMSREPDAAKARPIAFVAPFMKEVPDQNGRKTNEENSNVSTAPAKQFPGASSEDRMRYDLDREKRESANVFVKNLEKGVNSALLHETFSRFGTIIDCKIPVDGAGNNKGYGFVYFQAEEAARNAIATAHGTKLAGKEITVVKNKSKTALSQTQASDGGGTRGARGTAGTGPGSRRNNTSGARRRGIAYTGAAGGSAQAVVTAPGARGNSGSVPRGGGNAGSGYGTRGNLGVRGLGNAYTGVANGGTPQPVVTRPGTQGHYGQEPSAEMSATGNCPICTEGFDVNKIGALPCGHKFDYDCVLTWLRIQPTCPTCRAPTQSSSIQKIFLNFDNDGTVRSRSRSSRVAAAAAAATAEAAATNSEIGSVYVGNLHPDVTDAMLLGKFSTCGLLLSVHIQRDPFTQRSHGYAYVNYKSNSDAERALSMNGHLVGNVNQQQPMRVQKYDLDREKRESANVFVKNLEKGVPVDGAGNNKGYGYVYFQTQEAARNAIATAHGTKLAGKEITVKNLPTALAQTQTSAGGGTRGARGSAGTGPRSRGNNTSGARRRGTAYTGVATGGSPQAVVTRPGTQGSGHARGGNGTRGSSGSASSNSRNEGGEQTRAEMAEIIRRLSSMPNNTLA